MPRESIKMKSEADQYWRKRRNWMNAPRRPLYQADDENNRNMIVASMQADELYVYIRAWCCHVYFTCSTFLCLVTSSSIVCQARGRVHYCTVATADDDRSVHGIFAYIMTNQKTTNMVCSALIGPTTYIVRRKKKVVKFRIWRLKVLLFGAFHQSVLAYLVLKLQELECNVSAPLDV